MGSSSVETLAATRAFYTSTEWRKTRAAILARDGHTCTLCGSSERLQVDHITPRTAAPHLALEPSNLRTLCIHCNSKKGTRTGPERSTWMNPRYH